MQKNLKLFAAPFGDQVPGRHQAKQRTGAANCLLERRLPRIAKLDIPSIKEQTP
jgi:hypothetical protein